MSDCVYAPSSGVDCWIRMGSLPCWRPHVWRFCTVQRCVLVELYGSLHGGSLTPCADIDPAIIDKQEARHSARKSRQRMKEARAALEKATRASHRRKRYAKIGASYKPLEYK